MLDRIGDLPRMWPGNFGERIRLTNGIQVLDFPDVIFCFAFDSIPVTFFVNYMVDGDAIKRTYLMTRKSVW